MSYDDLDDWEREIEIENDNTPVLNVTNKEHLKQMEERKLVEESDNILTKELFEDKNVKQVINVTVNTNTTQNKEIYLKNKITKQKENEIKQKEIAKKNKEVKLQKENEVELFGEAEDYYYEDYEDKYYN